jgi:hypothetical protein
MPASPEVLYASLLRPFPTRALANVLRPVQAEAYALDHRLTELLIGPPGTPEAWAYELDELQTRLHALTARCEWASGRIRAMLAGRSVSGEGASLGSFEADSGPGDDAGGRGLRTPANDPEAGR